VTAVVAAPTVLGGRTYTARELAHLSYAIEREDLIGGGWRDVRPRSVDSTFAFSRERSPGDRPRDARILRQLECALSLCFTGSVRRHAGLIDTQMPRGRPRGDHPA
jgi:galactokinase/mevalonate kinase-like predicted kinase